MCRGPRPCDWVFRDMVEEEVGCPPALDIWLVSRLALHVPVLRGIPEGGRLADRGGASLENGPASQHPHGGNRRVDHPEVTAGSEMSTPLLRPASVRDLGPQFTRNPHQMIGQDGAYSIPLGAETLWFFGDTLVGTRVPGESLWYPGGVPVGHSDMTGKGTIRRMLNNTALLLADRDGRDGLRAFRYICD